MVISSSGTGTPGGIPEQSQLSDQTAAASVLRTAMGIVANLDTIIFTDVDRKALWKYDTSSSKPTLHPLEHARVEISPTGIDNNWKQILDDLVDDLPDDVRSAYQQNLTLPLDERNSALVALGRLLEGTAKTLNWIQNAAEALDPKNPIAAPGSERDARRIINNALAQMVMNGIMVDSNATLQSLRSAAAQIGANDPNFDGLTGLLNQIDMAYATIQNLNSPVEQG